MPSLRKKVSTFIRQLSVVNQQAEDSRSSPGTGSGDGKGFGGGCFIQRYLSGQDVRRMTPAILHGRSPHEIPPKALGKPVLGPDSVFAAVTGPDGGLTTVNRRERHVTTNDPDVDYIDLHDQAENDSTTVTSSECVFSRGYGRWFKIRPVDSNYPINNSVVRIRAAGSVFTVGAKSVHTSMSDLPSAVVHKEGETLSLQDNPPKHENPALSCADVLNKNERGISETEIPSADLRIDKSLLDKLALEDEANQNRHSKSVNTGESECNQGETEEEDVVIPPPADFAGTPSSTLERNNSEEHIPLPLRKSKSAPNPFKKVRGKHRFFQEREKQGQNTKLFEKKTEKEPRGSHASKEEEAAGVCNWFRPHKRAFGASTTLYELHPVTGQNAGNPIADCFAIVARKDSAVMALADGVNWGQKACIAARSAVHGCVDYLNKVLFTESAPRPKSTTDVFVALLRSFHAAHGLILQEEGMLTTLTAMVVLPLAVPGYYIACVCNVGDSLAYVYNPRNGVREITQGSHDIHSMRDMRDALGALGPVVGSNPELNNLTCSLTEVQEGDIVFLTSDGISDNFDPVVGKFAVLPVDDDESAGQGRRGAQGQGYRPGHRPRTSSHSGQRTGAKSSKGHARSASGSGLVGELPTVQAFQRHELTLLRMEDLLKLGVSGQGPPVCDAHEVCDLLLDFATRITAAKRHILEDPDLYCVVGEDNKMTELSQAEQRARRRKVCDKLAMVPGKLDHATVVAYQVGVYEEEYDGDDQADRLLETGL